MARATAGLGGRLLLGVAVGCLAPPVVAQEEALHAVWAITGARVVTMAGDQIESGVVVVRDGLIEAVGTDLAVPADAETIDGAGLTVYPGLIDALGEGILKMPERKQPERSSSGQYGEEDRGITPGLHAWEHANLGKATLSRHHGVGITAVQAMPTRGVMPGQAAILCLSDEEPNTAVLLRDSALGLTFTPGRGYPNSLMGVVAFLRQEMTDAAYYAMHTARWSASPAGVTRPAFNQRHETLAPAAEGSKPVIFICKNQNDIRRALRLRDELGLDATIADLGGEAFRVLPELQESGVPVLVSVTYKAPASAVWSQQTDADKQKAEKELYPSNARLLSEAGIPFAFASLGCDDPKSFMANVIKAVEAGLEPERAVRALTSDAARQIGAGQMLGTIEAGKIANLVITEGELLSAEATVKLVFADGKRFVVKDRKLKEGEAPTVNVTGRWELRQERGMGAGMSSIVTFTQEESSLSGTYSIMQRQIDFTDGEVAGNQIAFELSLSFGSRSRELFVMGTVEGDTIRGTVTSARGSNPFTAKRIP